MATRDFERNPKIDLFAPVTHSDTNLPVEFGDRTLLLLGVEEEQQLAL